MMEAIIGSAAPSNSADHAPGRDPSVQRPWRLLRKALKWLLFSVAMAFIVVFVPAFVNGVISGLAVSRGQAARPPLDYASLTPYAAIGLQLILFWGALSGASGSAAGNISEGLANRPVKRRKIVCLLAVLILSWDAIAVGSLTLFVQFGGHPPVVPSGVTRIPDNFGLAAIHIALLALIAPIAEEFFFRGWLWTALRKTWSPAWTLTVTGGLWLAMHGLDGIWRPLILLPTGIVLGLARHHGDSVRASLGLHLMNNGIVVLAQIAIMLAGTSPD